MCQQGLTSFDAAYSFGGYEGALRKLIHLFKYGKIETLAGPLSRLLISAIPLDAQFDLVVAMPMHWRKQWERGFNQAELLAAPVSARYGLPLSKAFRRRRYTQAQASLTEGQRRDNLIGSFFVKRPELIRGNRVLLVDDVFTTGSTLRSASDALKAAGAAHVTALTLARVDRKSPDEDTAFVASAGKRSRADRVARREQDFTAVLSDSAVPGSAEVGVT